MLFGFESPFNPSVYVADIWFVCLCLCFSVSQSVRTNLGCLCAPFSSIGDARFRRTRDPSASRFNGPQESLLLHRHGRTTVSHNNNKIRTRCCNHHHHLPSTE